MTRVRQLQISAIQATTDPTINDDTTTGVLIGHLWANTTAKNVFVCEDNATGAAVWTEFKADELTENVHLKSRGYWTEVNHPEAGKETHIGVIWRLSQTPGKISRPAPMLGEHNEYVFNKILGIGTEQINELMKEQIIY